MAESEIQFDFRRSQMLPLAARSIGHIEFFPSQNDATKLLSALDKNKRHLHDVRCKKRVDSIQFRIEGAVFVLIKKIPELFDLRMAIDFTFTVST